MQGFPFDILEQAFQGNPVAWYCVGLAVLFVVVLFSLLVVWWKMPQVSKSQFINNLMGGSKPTVIEVYENKKLRFINPFMHRNGFAYFKGLVYIPLKNLVVKSKIGKEEVAFSSEVKDLTTDVYGLEGTQSSAYINYVKSAVIMNPEIAFYIENEKILSKLNNENIEIDRAKFVEFLQSLKCKNITISPLHINFPIKDIRKLKEYLPKCVNKSDFMEFENKIRADERGDKQGVNYQSIMLILLLVSLLIGGLGLAKQFGLF